MSKTLTHELIEQKLAEQGWLDVNEIDQEDQKKIMEGDRGGGKRDVECPGGVKG